MSLIRLVPPELIGLPAPWGITNDFRRGDAARELRLEPGTFDVALSSLERALRALTHLPEPENLPIPEAIGDSYGFAVHELANQVPQLDDLPEQVFQTYLLELTGEQPDGAAVEALAQAWVHSVAAGIARSVLRWLTEHWAQFPRAQRPRMLEVAERFWAVLSEALAITLLTTTSTVARGDSLALLACVEEHGSTPALRQIGQKYRAWVMTRDDPAG